jgi:uncharacterized protein YegP (UPF0339 family)
MAARKESIEIYQDKRGEWRWRMVDGEGKVVGAACEGYNAKSDCEANAKRGKNTKDTWDFYTDRAGNWRWRRTASNGKIVGAAPAGFKSKGDAEANASRQGYSA